MKVARVLDVDLKINPLLLLLVPVAWYMGALRGLLTTFAVLLLHELGHVLAARLCGVSVLDMEILPFGGVARLSSAFELSPLRECIIAAAGPAVNLLLAMGAAFIARFAPLKPDGVNDFIVTNLVILCFNLLPGLPLDGGRICRAALTHPLGVKRATRAASIAGAALGAGVVALGVASAVHGVINITLFLTGGFLIYAAIREYRKADALYLNGALSRSDALRSRGVMPVRKLAVDGGMCVGDVMALFRPGYRYDVAVMDGGMREVRVLSEERVEQAYLEGGAVFRVGAVR